MRLYIYILLLPLLGFGSSQLWSAQNKSTMTENQKAIYTQLQAKKQELAQLLKSNNLSAKALTKDQQQIILAANKILKTYDAPQDIGKKKFEEYVDDWVKMMLKTVESVVEADNPKYKKEYLYVAEIAHDFMNSINKSTFPIGEQLWEHINKQLKGLGKKTTPLQLSKAVKAGLTSFNEYVQKELSLSDHYKQNRAAYRKIKAKDLEGLLMSQAQFNKWLKDALKGYAEFHKDFVTAYKEWKQEIEQIKKELVVDTIKDNFVNKAQFLSLIKSDFVTKNSSQYPTLTSIIHKEIVKEVKGIENMVMGDVKSGVTAAELPSLQYINSNIESIKEQYKQYGAFPSFMSIQSAASDASLPNSKFNRVYWSWMNEESSSALREEKALREWSNRQQFKVDDLKTEMKKVFKKGKDPHTAFLLNLFIDEFGKIETNKKGIAKLPAVEDAWNSAILKVNEKVKAYHGQLEKEKSITEINKLAEGIVFPTGKALGSALYESRYYTAKPKDVKGDTLRIQFAFDDNSVLFVNLITQTKTERGKTGILLAGSNAVVSRNGTKGYAFAIDGVNDSTAYYDSSLGAMITPIAFNIKAKKDRAVVTNSDGTITGSSTDKTGNYTYTRGTEEGTITGTNTSNTDETKTEHTNSTNTSTTNGSHEENSNTTGGAIQLNTPIGGEINHSRTATKGTNESETVENIDETVTTNTNSTTTEDINQVENKKIRSHAFSVGGGKTNYDQKTTNSSVSESGGKSEGGIMVNLKLVAKVGQDKKDIQVTVKDINFSQVQLDELELIEVGAAPSPLAIKLK